jgi:hypothetical protein
LKKKVTSLQSMREGRTSFGDTIPRSPPSTAGFDRGFGRPTRP